MYHASFVVPVITASEKQVYKKIGAVQVLLYPLSALTLPMEICFCVLAFL